MASTPSSSSSSELDLKRALRREFLARRLAVSASTRQGNDAAMVRSLGAWLRGANVSAVFLYLGYRGEPDLSALVTAFPGATFALPVIASGKDAAPTMVFRTWKPGEALAPNRFGIGEPAGGRVVAPDGSTVILAPALAIDHRGYRLGYGGGYYDRFLAEDSGGATTIGVVDQEFVVEALPTLPHDRAMDLIVTEAGVTPSRR